ncbi:hypothetical protein AJ80_08340 [Polytolypa hystricis UAMH7299]|uniref:Uncharacterized protein n=1 Tax=Polytolypa hystricis (strain UAMH7299) TaxID=1447883 RepID=A0A2B7X9H1_POLH7|nr:hypothetical protein AJ80_08340 [Polytolypa hystricis UAMH7299]
MATIYPEEMTFQTCVRINPHALVGASQNAEEQDVITTVTRPRTHEVFSSPQIRFFGPLTVSTGGLPLREYLVGPGEREGQPTNHFDDVPKTNATTYFAHYGTENLTANQFEVMWQFYRFAKGEIVLGMDDHIIQKILTPTPSASEPQSTYDAATRSFIFEGWTEVHYKAFFNEYCALRATDILRHTVDMKSAKEWMDLQPPRGLSKAESEAYEEQMHFLEQRMSELDINLDRYLPIAKQVKRTLTGSNGTQAKLEITTTTEAKDGNQESEASISPLYAGKNGTAYKSKTRRGRGDKARTSRNKNGHHRNAALEGRITKPQPATKSASKLRIKRWRKNKGNDKVSSQCKISAEVGDEGLALLSKKELKVLLSAVRKLGGLGRKDMELDDHYCNIIT